MFLILNVILYPVFIPSTYSRTHVYLCPLVYSPQIQRAVLCVYTVKNNNEKNEENLKESTRDKDQIVIFH